MSSDTLLEGGDSLAASKSISHMPLNEPLGWTFIGWVASLVWFLTDNSLPPRPHPNWWWR
jgi:hypothetical protein